MDHKTLFWINLIVQWGLTYYVYKDSAKKRIPYRNAFIVFTYIFWPVFFGYLYWRRSYLSRRDMSDDLKADIRFRKKVRDEREKIRLERLAWEEAKKEEAAKNRLTEEEIEAAAKKREEEHQKRLEELEEKMRRQAEENARILKIDGTKRPGV